MKRFLLLLVTVSLLLIACDSNLPPEPDAPGLAGRYFYAMPEWDWATAPVTFHIAEDDIVCSGDEPVILDYTVNDEFVYHIMYLWLEAQQSWEPIELQGQRIGNSNWLSGSGSFRTEGQYELPCTIAREFLADENDEVFAVAYSCSRDGIGWNCHGNKWQMQIAQVKEEDPLPPEPLPPGGIDLSCPFITLSLNEPQNIGGNMFEIVDGNTGSCTVMNPPSVLLDIYVSEDGAGLERWVSEGDRFNVQGRDIIVESIFVSDIPEEQASVRLRVNGYPVHVYLGQSRPARGLVFTLVDATPGECTEFESDPSVVLDVNGMRRTVYEGESYSFAVLDVNVAEIFVTEIPTFDASGRVAVSQNGVCLVPEEPIDTDLEITSVSDNNGKLSVSYEGSYGLDVSILLNNQTCRAVSGGCGGGSGSPYVTCTRTTDCDYQSGTVTVYDVNDPSVSDSYEIESDHTPFIQIGAVSDNDGMLSVEYRKRGIQSEAILFNNQVCSVLGKSCGAGADSPHISCTAHTDCDYARGTVIVYDPEGDEFSREFIGDHNEIIFHSSGFFEYNNREAGISYGFLLERLAKDISIEEGQVFYPSNDLSFVYEVDRISQNDVEILNLVTNVRHTYREGTNIGNSSVFIQEIQEDSVVLSETSKNQFFYLGYDLAINKKSFSFADASFDLYDNNWVVDSYGSYCLSQHRDEQFTKIAFPSATIIADPAELTIKDFLVLCR